MEIRRGNTLDGNLRKDWNTMDENLKGRHTDGISLDECHCIEGISKGTAAISGSELMALYNAKLFLTHISVYVAQIKKLKKADWHFFGQIGLVATFPTQIQIHKYTNTQIHKYSI